MHQENALLKLEKMKRKWNLHGDAIMPFGRFRGRRVSKVPLRYLDTVVGNIEKRYGNPPKKFQRLYECIVRWLESNKEAWAHACADDATDAAKDFVAMGDFIDSIEELTGDNEEKPAVATDRVET